MRMVYCYYLFFSYFILSVIADPFIVVPTFFKIGEVNEIRVLGHSSDKCVILINKERTNACHKSYVPQEIGNGNAPVKIIVNDVQKFDKNVDIRTNLAKVHIHLDKPIYKVNDYVNIRVLPLTHSGDVYRHSLKIYFVNGKGFAENATIKTIKVNQDSSIIAESIQIPSFTFFGDWKVVLHPIGYEIQEFVQYFRVSDYILPIFTLSGQIHETTKKDNVTFTVVSRYSHGKPVNGNVYLYCQRNGVQKTQLKSAKLTNGEWTGNANLTDCGEKILIEARESGSGLKQDYTIDWDLRKPKFEIIALRPYFNSETEQVQILIESAGISTGIVNIELVALKGDLGKVDTTTLTAPAANIDTIVNIPLPESWKTNVKVISVKATRQIDENDKSRVLTLYLPNLDKSVLSKTLLTINNPKVNYVYNDVIDVKITRVNNLLYKFLIVCSSNIPQWIEDDGNSTILKIKISQKMDGTCYLAALMTEKTTTNSRNVFSDVILFRVRNFCESCNVQINKIDSHGMRKPLASPHDSVEPRDTVELAFTGSPFSLVIYRVIDDRLNHIENINMAEESEDYDYLFTFSKKTSGINIFSDGDWKGITDRIIDACCENLGSFFDGSDQKSRISKECLNKLNGCPSIDQLNAPLRVRNGGLPITVSTHQRKTLLVEQRVDDVSVPQEENKNSRKIFPETWLFDSIILPSNGSGTITAEVPDSITTWEVGSQFWAKGKLSLYRAKTERIYTKKSIFLEFDLPKHVYVNEIISPLITVATSSSQNQKGSRDNKMVLCLSKLPRHVCGDQGVDGKKGEAYYNRIDLTGKQSDAKYVMLNFLTAGAFNVTVTLQWHSCESNAELIDAVTRLVVVQKRPDTRTYEEAHTINPEKESSANMDRTIITFSDKKSATEPDTMHTLIRSDLEDSDTVYSFKLTISEFLQPERKIVREYEDRMPRTLTSVIKDFASTLYDFKTISLEKNEDKTELKQRVNSLENRLMGFSDCSSDGKPCGYNFFGPPVDSKSYSILLTAIATSLLCSADAEKSRVNGSLQTVMKYIPRLNDTDFNADLSDIIDIENVEDKKFIIVSFLFRAIKDCRNYTMNSIKSYNSLTRYLYELDENSLNDRRTLAAIASMASDATSELMRGHLLTRMDSKKKPPFWNCGSYDIDGPNQETNYFNKRREESCQLLTNSLALSAVVNANAEGGDYDWDSLAEWISDKQANLGTFGNSINTVIVKRSLYEKKRKSLDNSNGNIKVTISCDTCTEKTINVTNQAEEIHIPVNQRTVKLKVQGKGKVTVTARIIANMRPRQKRQLPQSVYYPVNIIVNQIHSARNVIQTVCLNVSTPVIRTLEISHGTYTLFDPIESSLKFLNNSQTPINVAVSSVGIHFMIKNIVANKTICYELQLGESNKGRNSPSLASPVPIRATHDVQGLVGMVLISHPDAPKSTPKRKRVSITRSRFIREISDPDMSVDKICFDNGNCACAELTCDVQYNQCPYDDQTKLSKKLQQKGNFILRVRASNITNETYNNVEYSIITCKITDYKPQSAKEKLPDNLNQDIRIWVRSCNEYTRNNTVYMIMGHEDGWTQNSKSNYNYIMNSNDRIEENTKKCGVLNSFITLSD